MNLNQLQQAQFDEMGMAEKIAILLLYQSLLQVIEQLIKV